MCVSLCLGPLPDSEEETLADTGVNHDGTDVEFPEADATQRTPSAGDLGDGGAWLRVRRAAHRISSCVAVVAPPCPIAVGVSHAQNRFEAPRHTAPEA